MLGSVYFSSVDSVIVSTAKQKVDKLNNWQAQLSKGLKNSLELFEYLGLPLVHLPKDYQQLEQQFKLKIPIHFANKMQKKNLSCPLLLQVLPQSLELEKNELFQLDPLQEKLATVQPGLLHKYQSRVLLTLAGNCAVNCRYCFRRHFPYQENQISPAKWQAILEYISQHKQINEVIFSGGDPLLVANTKLQYYFESLAEINHIKTLRFHTRIPIVLPARVDKEFINLLQQERFKVVMVTHANHGNELCGDTQMAFEALYRSNVTLLNQSVLLKGVNDEPNVLAELSTKLFEQRVMPYYLHLLDKVQGAQHFDVPQSRALEIYAEMQSILPGYLLPRLVREEADKPSKSLVYA